ncbi:MAG: hypothetical protein LBQ05_03415 [Christensenellaceae bacterium]|jgi:hypothetical protein|nr:hypothetical protein [Christensenellaceae bacterium]
MEDISNFAEHNNDIYKLFIKTLEETHHNAAAATKAVGIFIGAKNDKEAAEAVSRALEDVGRHRLYTNPYNQARQTQAARYEKTQPTPDYQL